MAGQSCFHCGGPIPADVSIGLLFDGEPRALCCRDCESVMRSVLDADLGDYYLYRTHPAVCGAVPAALRARLDEFGLYDEPELGAQFLHESDCQLSRRKDEGGARLVDVTLAVEGMRCGGCVWALEKHTGEIAGVHSAHFNYATGRAQITFDADRLALSALLCAIADLGYSALPFDAAQTEKNLAKQSRRMTQRLFVAGIAMMQVMMFALPGYLSAEGDIELIYQRIMAFASLVLTVPVVIFSAQPILVRAWRDLVALTPGMDVPVALGVISAFLASAHATVTGRGELYFDSVTMFVFLLLLARHIEWSLRLRAARALSDISGQVPDSANRLRLNGQLDNASQLVQSQVLAAEIDAVPASRLRIGDLIRVDSGERVPVDGTVVAGQSAVDNAVLTGESVPVALAPGAAVVGGALVLGSPVVLRVTQCLSGSAVSLIEQLIHRGAAEKPRSVQLADRVAGVFVGVLLLFAVSVFAIWMQIDSARALVVAITVLVVSCPCALSLATPAAMAATVAKLMRERILVTRGHAVDSLAQITDAVFDKTGTLTAGEPVVVSVQSRSHLEHDALLSLAAELEVGSAHPYARAIQRAATGSVTSSGLTDVYHCIGSGVEARHPALGLLRLGSAAWCGVAEGEMGNGAEESLHSGVPRSWLYLCRYADTAADPVVLGLFGLSDAVRPESARVVQQLQQAGIRVHLLSGDSAEVVAAVADALGVGVWSAEQTPAGKQRYVRALQSAGACVAMLGDGVNDAPVLACANVSIAVSNASTLTKTAADVVSLQPGIAALPGLFATAARTRRTVRQNLIWAASYNACAIPAAALGFVPPLAAAAGMAVSSIVVVGNAARLWFGQLQSPSRSMRCPPVQLSAEHLHVEPGH